MIRLDPDLSSIRRYKKMYIGSEGEKYLYQINVLLSFEFILLDFVGSVSGTSYVSVSRRDFGALGEQNRWVSQEDDVLK